MTATCEQTDNLEYRVYDSEHELDCEFNLLQNNNNTCNYYADSEFDSVIESNGSFSLIHLNCRSMYSNFDKIHDYLNTFKNKFTVIALSETWLTDDKGFDFPFDGYELFFVNRVSKKGGGVALYICSDLKCKIIESMTTVIENLMECITVEIEMKKQRNIMVTCIYRTPGSSIKTFSDNLEQLLVEMNENKMSIICGDFNINLLNVCNHPGSSDFLDLMYSKGLYPTITKPSRITSSCSTLIDNIFTNILENSKIKSGLLINDITDHLPVFLGYCYDMQVKKEKYSKFVRVRSEERIRKFKEDLLNEDWDSVYNTNDVNEA